MKKCMMLRLILICCCVCSFHQAYCWGFYGHKRINFLAVFLLPPEMLVFYKQHIRYLEEHAVDADKRRYAVPQEGPRHYIDLDKYGDYPFSELPRNWREAVDKFGEDSLNAHGIAPWWISTMLSRLTSAFSEKNSARILKLSADLGHYIADVHVPLHTSSNHDGQHTGQKGIHGFWESRIPELLAEQQWDLLTSRAQYLDKPAAFIWDRVLESALASDSVLKIEKKLSQKFPADQRFSFENRNGAIIRQYSSAYTIAYDREMNGMVERRMRSAILAVASCWYTAWVNAGQPSLRQLSQPGWDEAERAELEQIQTAWQKGEILGREH
ncbi:MAG: zinc dependent phospholipase C family protein [Chitinophagaceae bacterium]|nr:zinc dependent phospholipase C family protein [Chitinophagaceae bacterium]